MFNLTVVVDYSRCEERLTKSGLFVFIQRFLSGNSARFENGKRGLRGSNGSWAPPRKSCRQQICNGRGLVFKPEPVWAQKKSLFQTKEEEGLYAPERPASVFSCWRRSDEDIFHVVFLWAAARQPVCGIRRPLFVFLSVSLPVCPLAGQMMPVSLPLCSFCLSCLWCVDETA